MIRKEKHFVWNFTVLMGFLGVGFSVGFLLGLTQPDTLLGALGRIFVHLGGGHILGNIASVFLIGLVLAVFAHPLEFVGVLGSTVVMNMFLYQSIPVSGLSVVVFAMVGASALFLVGVIFELKQFDGPGNQLLVVGTALVLLVVIGVRYQGQLLHDTAVVLFDQPVQMAEPNYTRQSSLGHFVGFCWGCVAAVGSRLLRYSVGKFHGTFGTLSAK